MINKCIIKTFIICSVILSQTQFKCNALMNNGLVNRFARSSLTATVGNSYVFDRDSHPTFTDGLSPFQDKNNRSLYWVRVGETFKIFTESSTSHGVYPSANYIQLRDKSNNNTIYFNRTSTNRVTGAATAGNNGVKDNFSLDDDSINWTAISTSGMYYNYTHFHITPKIDGKEYKLWVSAKLGNSMSDYKNTGITIKTDGEGPTYESAEKYFDSEGNLHFDIKNIADAGSGNKKIEIKINAADNPHLVKTITKNIGSNGSNFYHTVFKYELDQLYAHGVGYNIKVYLYDEVGNKREVVDGKPDDSKPTGKSGYIYTKVIEPGARLKYLLIRTSANIPNDTVVSGKVYYSINANNSIDKTKYVDFKITDIFNTANIIELPDKSSKIVIEFYLEKSSKNEDIKPEIEHLIVYGK